MNLPFAHGVAPDPAQGLAWPFDPLVWALVGGAAGLYLAGVRRLGRWPLMRTVCWSGGLAVVLVALASPLAVYDTALLSIHMVQHLLLTHIAAPLLVAGAPVGLAARASPGLRRAARRLIHSAPVRSVTNPIATWTLFTAVTWATHFTPLYDAGLENEAVHSFEHALYMGAGLLYWWPVVAVDPGARRLSFPARLAYVALQMPVGVFVALAIHSSGEVLYRHYATIDRAWGPDPLVDQRAAAVTMWIGGNLLMLGALVIVLFAWMRTDERQAVRIDRRLGRA